MKRLNLLVLISAIITGSLLWYTAHAQQPASVAAATPTPITLNADASKQIIQIQAEMDRLRDLQQAYLRGAGVPKEWWSLCQFKDQVVTCYPPPTAK